MKLTAQGAMIDGVTHILFSPQCGTDCGIQRRTEYEDILELTGTEQVTCQACLNKICFEYRLLRDSLEKK